jgi:hypothetical protein
MPRDCVVTEPPITETRCTECPEIAPIPSSVIEHPILGWNAGANSVVELDGDVHVVFYVPESCAGIVLGFKQSRAFQVQPELITHGFWLSPVSGQLHGYVTERGVRKTPAALRAATDKFEIRRRAGAVSYHVNDALIYTSAVRLYGPVLVNACLYATGDAIA